MTVPPKSGPIDLSGQVAMVTGAARGIGRVAALTLAREGAIIVAADQLSCADTITALREAGAHAIEAVCDVTDAKSIGHLVQEAVRRFGRLDILVTAAGVLGSADPADWDRVLAVNLKGSYLATEAVLPVMVSQRYGKIVYIGSLGAQGGGLIAGPAYVASKGGIHGLVKWVAKAYASKGIFANAVAPGQIRTAMVGDALLPDETFPVGRPGEPEDIAEAVLFLASQASHYVTGTVLDVNGGLRFN